LPHRHGPRQIAQFAAQSDGPVGEVDDGRHVACRRPRCAAEHAMHVGVSLVEERRAERLPCQWPRLPLAELDHVAHEGPGLVRELSTESGLLRSFMAVASSPSNSSLAASSFSAASNTFRKSAMPSRPGAIAAVARPPTASCIEYRQSARAKARLAVAASG